METHSTPGVTNPGNAPLPASDILALADAMLEAHDAWEARFDCPCGCDQTIEPCEDTELQLQNAIDTTVEAYRAARAASPRTLEEDILTDIGRGFIKSDEIERQNRYPNDDEQAEMEKVLVRFEEHARRLAGEGGA